MSKRKPAKRPGAARAGSKMKVGKGWRLVSPKKKRTLKAALLSTFASGRDRYAIFLLKR